MQVGKGVKAEKAQNAITKAGGLVPGEDVVLYVKCNNIRPMVDVLLLTNARVLGFSPTEGLYKFRAPLTGILSVDYDALKGKVGVTTVDQQTMTFKSMNAGDVALVEQHLERHRANPAPAEVMDAVTALGTAGSSVLNIQGTMPGDLKAAKDAYKSEAKVQRDLAKNEAKAERNAVKAAEKERVDAERAAARAEAGALVLSDTFASKTVEIYQNGYVRISGHLFGVLPETPYERLLSIEASSDVVKKSAVGRGLGALATGGLNLAFTDKRGDVYLTIVTDHTTRVVHLEAPNKWDLKSSKKLEAAGNAVLAAVGQDTAVTHSAAAPVIDLPERLRQLNAMRDEGLISDEEFTNMRQDLLKSM